MSDTVADPLFKPPPEAMTFEGSVRRADEGDRAPCSVLEA